MSIFQKITILFVISFTLMSAIGFWIDSINTNRVEGLIKDKYLKIANEIFENIDNQDKINELISIYNLKTKDTIKESSESLYYKKHTFGFLSIKREIFEDEFIIHINFLDDEYILKTPDEKNLNDRMMLNALILLDLFVLALIFLYILNLLQPLKKITKTIEEFSAGNLESRIDIDSKDEIGKLSRTFNSMAKRLEELVKTQEELLRDIGHELRTPIAKGMFVIERVEDSTQKELLRKIFIDLELLTNELIELEKLKSTTLNLTTFGAETLILQSLDKLYIDDENLIFIKVEKDFKIRGDIYYLSIALKNLIDNALKYMSTPPVVIEAKNRKISIQNSGERLSKELEYYLKPFTQELMQRDGFGLGLSIVEKVISRHQIAIDYEYKDGRNIFSLDFKNC